VAVNLTCVIVGSDAANRHPVGFFVSGMACPNFAGGT
jgi:hypothetical protein